MSILTEFDFMFNLYLKMVGYEDDGVTTPGGFQILKTSSGVGFTLTKLEVDGHYLSISH